MSAFIEAEELEVIVATQDLVAYGEELDIFKYLEMDEGKSRFQHVVTE